MRSASQLPLVAAIVGLVIVGVVLLPQVSRDYRTAFGAAPTTDGHTATPAGALPPPGGVVVPATYQPRLLGVPVTFTTDESFVLGQAQRGHFVLLSRNVQANPNNDRAIIVTRVGGWNTREDAMDVDLQGTESIDPYHFDGWTATNDVLADSAVTTTVYGRPTTVLDVRVDPDSTIRQDNCSVPSDDNRPEPSDRMDWNPCATSRAINDTRDDTTNDADVHRAPTAEPCDRVLHLGHVPGRMDPIWELRCATPPKTC